MASRALATTALLLTLNLLFFTLVSSHTYPPTLSPKPPTPSPKPPTPAPTTPSPNPPTPTPIPTTPSPKPPTPTPTPTTPSPKPPTPTPTTPSPKPPTPTPTPTKPSPKPPKPSSPPNDCVCANLLKEYLIHLVLGKPPKTPCCTLIDGFADLEAANCLCTAIKANVLGTHLNIPVSLGLLLNYCGKEVPFGFQCA